MRETKPIYGAFAWPWTAAGGSAVGARGYPERISFGPGHYFACFEQFNDRAHRAHRASSTEDSILNRQQ